MTVVFCPPNEFKGTTCASCVYWLHDAPKRQGFGWCCKSAPVPRAVRINENGHLHEDEEPEPFVAGWPMTRCSWGCGEFKPREWPTDEPAEKAEPKTEQRCEEATTQSGEDPLAEIRPYLRDLRLLVELLTLRRFDIADADRDAVVSELRALIVLGFSALKRADETRWLRVLNCLALYTEGLTASTGRDTILACLNATWFVHRRISYMRREKDAAE